MADGRYEIQRLLGAGGMGAVYLARQVSMDRWVALKLIHAQAESFGRDVAKRFQQEMRVSAKIEHPNTIRVYDYGETDGRLYLAMEYLEGKSLRDTILPDRPLDVERALRIATQIAKALGAAHSEGVVHRDLKPENIILLNRYGEQDFVKILDFGIARSLDPGSERLTIAGGVIGTPAYMSPEQAAGRAVDGRTDLYALGIIIFEMLCGSPPFQKPTTMSLLVAQMTEPPPPILQRVPTLEPGLASLVDRLLAKEPDQRPANAAEVLAQLTMTQSLPATKLRTEVLPARPASSSPQEPPRRQTQPDPSASDRSPTLRRNAIIVLCLLAIGLGGVVALRRHRAAKRPLRGESSSRNGTGSSSSARTALDRRLREWGEPLPAANCQAKEERTLSILVDALEALRPSEGVEANPKKAIALLARADIASAERWMMLARAQFSDGDDDEVATSVRRALALCPEYAAAYNIQGKSLQRSGKLDEAEAEFRLALSSDRAYAAPQFNLALLWLRKGDATAAITVLTTLIQGLPDTPHVFLVRGQARLMAKDLAGAEADLREAIRRSPEEADPWLLLGQVLGRVGKKDEGQKALCRAKALGAALRGLTCRE